MKCHAQVGDLEKVAGRWVGGRVLRSYRQVNKLHSASGWFASTSECYASVKFKCVRAKENKTNQKKICIKNWVSRNFSVSSLTLLHWQKPADYFVSCCPLLPFSLCCKLKRKSFEWFSLSRQGLPPPPSSRSDSNASWCCRVQQTGSKMELITVST